MVPVVTTALGGVQHVYDPSVGSRDDTIIQACLDFVIDSAVALRSHDQDA
jgi:hypothetical protein